MMARLPLAATLSTLAVGALMLGACSSSGGGSSAPSQAKVVAAVKKDSSFAAVKELPAAKQNGVYTCIAKVLETNATPGSLNNYVSGKIKTADGLTAKAGATSSKAESQAEACATSAE